MRLWSKQLIHVLPRQQLVANWRECSAIAGNILTKGTPNHILVNKIMDYPIDHFITFTARIHGEMTMRGYRTTKTVWDKIEKLNPNWQIVDFDELFKDWMDNTYLTICYWNLYEKYSCGGMTADEWYKINNEFYTIGNCPFVKCL